MINRGATIRWKGYDPDTLSYGSGKRVWANCDKCGDGRWIRKQDSDCLCIECSAKKRWFDEMERDKQSQRTTDYYKNNPEAGKLHSEFMKEYCSDPDRRKAKSDKMKEYCADPKVRKLMSERMFQWYKDHPEAVDAFIIRMIAYWGDQYNCDVQSDKIRQFRIDNPNFYDGANESMRGGYDIVDHHMIYDHSDLTKNVMPMTRSTHTKLHRLFQKYGIIIPHINS